MFHVNMVNADTNSDLLPAVLDFVRITGKFSKTLDCLEPDRNEENLVYKHNKDHIS